MQHSAPAFGVMQLQTTADPSHVQPPLHDSAHAAHVTRSVSHAGGTQVYDADVDVTLAT